MDIPKINYHYKLLNANQILRIEDNAYIPMCDENRDYQEYLQWLAQGNTPDQPEIQAKTPEQLQAELTAAVQSYMDTAVKVRNYDSIMTACTYVTSTDPIFKSEGLACIKWRDAVWRKCYEVMAAVNIGNRAAPSADELIAELPALDWGNTTNEAIENS